MVCSFRLFAAFAVTLGALSTAPVAISCGGGVSRGGPGATDAATPDADGVWTQCSTPDGLMICGGPSACSANNCSCLRACDDAGELAICATPAFPTGAAALCFHCKDGNVCVMEQLCAPTDLVCVPYTLGVLFAKNGGAARVRYADFSDWTGDPLPEPDNCPTLNGVNVCGGHCGACGSGEVCTGRSPLHPFGICVAAESGGCRIDQVGSNGYCGDSTKSCFTFKVQPAAQAVANINGLCLSLAQCEAFASQLPGGGTCTH